MVASVERHREAIEALCRRFHVRRLELFGSAAREDFDPSRSDLDVLVEFEALGEGRYADAWFGLLEALEELLGRHVDMVSAEAIRNPYFRAELERTRVPLYAA